MARGFKTGGRKKGTPNKTSEELRELITSFLDENWEQVKKDMKTLEPKERIKFYIDLMGYAVPKISSTKMDMTTNGEKINNQPKIIVQDQATADEIEKLIAGK